MKLLFSFVDRLRTALFDLWAATPHGNARLVSFHDAVVDANDTLEAVAAAIADGHVREAQTLIGLGRESLQARLTELKGML